MKKILSYTLILIVFIGGTNSLFAVPGNSNEGGISFSDTLILSTDTVFVAYPSMIYSSDSIFLFFDNMSETILTYSAIDNKLLGINQLNEYIDRVQHPQGIYALGAFSRNTLYCFLYKSLFIIDLKNKTSVLSNNFFEDGGLGYTIDSYTYTKAYDPVNKEFYFSAFPPLSVSDKKYLDKRDIFSLNIHSSEYGLINLNPPGNYKRGMDYNILDKPCLAFGDGSLYCAYPIAENIIVYNNKTKLEKPIPFSSKYIEISSGIIPKDAEKSRMMAYYHFIANSVIGLYFDNGKLYALYKEADQDYLETKKMYKKLYLWAFDVAAGEVVMDRELDFMNGNISISNINNDKIYFNYSDPDSDLENNFKMLVYDIQF